MEDLPVCVERAEAMSQGQNLTEQHLTKTYNKKRFTRRPRSTTGRKGSSKNSSSSYLLPQANHSLIPTYGSSIIIPFSFFNILFFLLYKHMLTVHRGSIVIFVFWSNSNSPHLYYCSFLISPFLSFLTFFTTPFSSPVTFIYHAISPTPVFFLLKPWLPLRSGLLTSFEKLSLITIPCTNELHCFLFWNPRAFCTILRVLVTFQAELYLCACLKSQLCYHKSCLSRINLRFISEFQCLNNALKFIGPYVNICWNNTQMWLILT